MADTLDLKGVISHITNGTLEQSLCRVCLLPLGEDCENIFTRICKEDQEYCIADALRSVCPIEISDEEDCSICSNCLAMATTAYKLHILSKRSEEILNFYVDELTHTVFNFELPQDFTDDNICFPLLIYEPTIDNFNFGIQACLSKENPVFHDKVLHTIKKEPKTRLRPPIVEVPVKEKVTNNEIKKEIDDDNMVVIIQEDGSPTVYQLQEDGSFQITSKNMVDLLKDTGMKRPPKDEKLRRKRNAMSYKSCSRCPVKYRFLAKLKEHMKQAHNVDLFVCKVCKETLEDEEEFNRHLQCHTNVHRCNMCNVFFRKRDTMIAHLKWHDEMKNLIKTDTANVCEMCGFILPSEEKLKEHYDEKHEKKFTCYYCGKMYRSEESFNCHIKKHENLPKKAKTLEQAKTPNVDDKKKSKPKTCMCPTCGRSFVDERSLMWHSMLHTNERPFTCDVCGRGFVSLNRRNQHALCAHTMPTKRCPLCPALFHLRSMVNTHIKKVHLASHKRRRLPRARPVSWRTAAVPLQELAVAVQARLLDLKVQPDQMDVQQELGDDF